MAPFESQNKTDDDGPVIDSYFIETDAPPNLRDALEPIPANPTANPIPTGRLLTGSISMDAARFTMPTMVLPADAKRKSITITTFSTAASPTAQVEYVLMSDENGSFGFSSRFTLRHGKDPLVLDGYTGAVWVMPATTVTAAIEVSWVAVTS
jgi:hypothetical protein